MEGSKKTSPNTSAAERNLSEDGGETFESSYYYRHLVLLSSPP